MSGFEDRTADKGKKMDEILIVIPSLEPDEKLVQLTGDLKKEGFSHILIVNDGSGPEYDPVFEEAVKAGSCKMLRHCVNQGKGRAMKTAFNEFLAHPDGCKGVVTVDSDGQHRPEDIRKCCEALLAHPECLIMGSRDFDAKDVPLKSSFGNKLTRQVFGFLSGIHIRDTQTGLRGFSPELVHKFLSTAGERFEYEMNMLMDCKEYGIPILEVPIETVYLEANAGTHFHPIRDSIRIYAIFGKFLATSLSSSVIDIVMFTVFVSLLKLTGTAHYILLATVGARILSSIYNYLMNKGVVFRCEGKVQSTFIKYYTLCIVQMLCSAGLVALFFGMLRLNETVVKIVVDTFLFLISFRIQKEWVFKKG